METVVCLGSALFLLFVQGFLPAPRSWKNAPTFSTSVPVVGVRKEIFAATRACARSFFGSMTNVLDGYRQYGQHDRPFVLYNTSGQQEMLLPIKDLKWFSDQPDTKLSSHLVSEERFAYKYLQIDAKHAETMHFLDRIIGDQFTRHLEVAQAPLHDELRRCIDEAFGTDEEAWTELNVYKAMQTIAMPAICRVILGLPLARDPRLLKVFSRYLTVLHSSMVFLGQLPRSMKGVLARLASFPLRYYGKATLNVLAADVKMQLDWDSQGRGDKSEGSDFVRSCAKISERNPVGGFGQRASPQVIAQWIMTLGSAAVPSTAAVATSLLVDVVNCPPELQVWQELRKEAEINLSSEEDWTKSDSFTKLIRTDSVIRENLRFRPTLIKGLIKEVVPEDGLRLPDGTHVPNRSWIGVPLLGIHRDTRYYERADAFEPFRFVHAHRSKDAPKSSAGIDEPQAAKPTTTYVGFAYGKHACPGRWFAVLMLKMIIAYLSLHYDIEATGPAPPTMSLGEVALPPMSSTVKVRRRNG